MPHPYDLSTQVTDLSRQITNLLGQMGQSLKEHGDLLKALPALQADVATLEARKAGLLQDVEAAEIALSKASNAKAKILRELQGA